jgi:hypothetical protein
MTRLPQQQRRSSRSISAEVPMRKLEPATRGPERRIGTASIQQLQQTADTSFSSGPWLLLLVGQFL